MKLVFENQVANMIHLFIQKQAKTLNVQEWILLRPPLFPSYNLPVIIIAPGQLTL